MRPQSATTTITRVATVTAGVFAPGHLGELTQYLPFELVDDVLEQTRTVQRRLRDLPSRAGVYFVLALGILPRLGYARVWGKLTAGLAGLPVPCPSEKALRDLRRRLGEVADGADPLDAVQVAVAINLSPEEVPWESSPEGTDWLANELRLSKGGFLYFWRSHLDPIWNHYIRGPVRIWSVDDGPDEQALTALEARDFGSLKRLIPEPADGRLQLREDLGAALAHLREVRDKYWDHGWRRGQRGYGRYPENELWEAVEGFLDLVDASRSSKPDT